MYLSKPAAVEATGVLRTPGFLPPGVSRLGFLFAFRFSSIGAEKILQ
jgi:hypothetical protein